MIRRFALLCASGLINIVLFSIAEAANDVWDNNPGVNWENGANWVDNSTPTIIDTATFNLAQTYIVSFGAAPSSILSLTVSAGSVTFQSTGGTARTLGVNSGAGSDVNLSGASTVLNLGPPGGTFTNALNLTVADNLSVQGGATLNINAGSDVVASDFGAGLNGTIRIDGDSTLTLSGAFQNMVGVSGTAAINIGTTVSGGTLTTGTELFTIGATGSVNVGSGANTGTLLANGDITIDGGLLQFNNFASAFDFDGRTMNIQNGGRYANTGFRILGVNSTYNVTGVGSELSVSAGDLRIQNSSEVHVSAGGKVSADSHMAIAQGGGDGTLTVTGNGSSATAGANSTSSWGANGDTVTVTFSDNATGTFGKVSMAPGNDANDADTVALVTVQSGADVSFKDITMAAGGGSATDATLTVTGAGSSVTLGGADVLTVGNSSVGEATVNILNGGALIVGAGGTTILNATGTINLNGGTFNTPSFTGNGTFNFTSGTLGITGPAGLTIGAGVPLGSSFSLGSNRTINVTNTTTISAGSALTLGGGTLITGALVVDGTLEITHAGTSINTAIVSSSPSTINILATNISLGSFASFTGFHHQGTLNVGANNIVLNSAGYARLGVLTSLNGGTINAGNGVALGSGSNLLGHGVVGARVAAELGSVIEADGALALGDGTSPAGYVSNGELRTKQFAVTLNSSAQATLGNLTTLGNGASPGTLNATNGLVVDFGRSITGFGAVNTTNTLAKRTVINGLAQGASVGQPLTFSGYVKGTGTFINVNFTGTLDPGLSPTVLTVGNIGLSSTSALIIELGGTSPGSGYDQIQSSGVLTLDGTLQVTLINSFQPAAGQAFDILDWITLVGTFDTLQLPTLAGGKTWNTSALYTTGVLSVVAALHPGDFDSDGDVDGADFVAWQTNFPKATGATLAQGDADGDGDVDGADFVVWQTNFPHSPGPGAAPVPEPAVGRPCGIAWVAFAGRLFLRRCGRPK